MHSHYRDSRSYEVELSDGFVDVGVVLTSNSKVIPSSLVVTEVSVSGVCSKTIDEVDLSSLGEASFKVLLSLRSCPLK